MSPLEVLQWALDEATEHAKRTGSYEIDPAEIERSPVPVTVL